MEKQNPSDTETKPFFGSISRRFFDCIFDLIFPKEAMVAELEKMSPAEFRAKADTSDNAKIAPHLIGRPDIFSLFPYRNAYVQAAIWQMKYKGNKKIARLIASFVSEKLHALAMAELAKDMEDNVPNKENPSDRQILLVLPVPISSARRKERGYNQVELLLDCLDPLPENVIVKKDLLVKVRDTAPQTETRSRQERLQNLEGCFALKQPDQVKGRMVVIVDDVLTTGSTFAEARKILLAAGAPRVFCLAVAH